MPKNPPNLPRLLPSTDPADRVQVQQTALAYDVLARYVCNDWGEVQASLDDGGYPFDAVFIGAGMFGAYCAAHLYSRGVGRALRILVLDAGAFLFATHIQDLPERLGGSVGGPAYLRTREDGSGAQNVVWGMPWISNEPFAGLAYCLGGRSLFFGGWSPRLTANDLVNWPPDVASYLVGGAGTPGAYERTEQEIGTADTTDYMMGDFHDTLLQAFRTATSGRHAVANVTAIEEAPLAVQASAPGPGLFPFDKFSSGPFFIEAVRDDAANNSAYGDVSRRLFIVPRAHVIGLPTNGNAVTGIDVSVDGQRRFVAIDPSCAVVLANGTIEASRLALDSLGLGTTQFRSHRVGNLMAHLRSNITVRIKREALGLPAGPPTALETTALLVRGETRGRRFHLQVTAGATGTADPERNLWEQIPDIDLQDEMRANQDPQWITITFRGIGEMEDERTPSPDPARNWIDLSPETDEFGRPRAYVHITKTQNDMDLWKDMDAAAFELALSLAGDAMNIQYWNKGAGTWQAAQPQPGPDGSGPWRDGLGTTHHEAGTLFMGDPGASFTDHDGKLHDFTNVYVAGPAVFPTLGSANPSLTALALARRTAGAIVERSATITPDGFTPLSADPADWRMVARGGQPIMRRLGDVWETMGGYGLYWYTREQLSNFVLHVEWRVARPDDNSGVYVRIPSPDVPDALNAADQQGHEIQINPVGAPDGAAVHRTGAIYSLQGPDSYPEVVGRWNTYEIEANGPQITVTLNGIVVNTYQSAREQAGYLALQAHHWGSRVQFGNLAVKKL